MTNNSISASMRFLILGICCFVLSIGHGFAQGPTGQITGVVTDANDAVIPNATVTITNKNNNATQTTTASEDGIYRFVSLQPGSGPGVEGRRGVYELSSGNDQRDIAGRHERGRTVSPAG